MKNTSIIKSLIGFTQEEMAILLRISISQWSMHKSGQRDLPLHALKQFGAILTHLKNNKETSSESQKLLALEQIKTQAWFKRELLNLEYKKIVLNRKILALKDKRTECFAALETIQFLETQQPEIHTDLLESIKMRVANTLNKNALHQLQDLQIKKEQVELAIAVITNNKIPLKPFQGDSPSNNL